MYSFRQIPSSVIWDNDEVVETDGADTWWCGVMSDYYYFMPIEIGVNLNLTVDVGKPFTISQFLKMWKCYIKAADFCSTLQDCNFKCQAQTLTLKSASDTSTYLLGKSRHYL